MTNRTFYLAGRFDRREELANLAARISRHTGWESAARWLASTHPADAPVEVLQRDALDDLTDIHRADVFVLVEEPQVSPGRLIEFGVALARGKRVIVLGTFEESARSIFFLHPTVEWVNSLEAIR